MTAAYVFSIPSRAIQVMAGADHEVHHDSPEKREESLKFGTNIIVWALTN